MSAVINLLHSFLLLYPIAQIFHSLFLHSPIISRIGNCFGAIANNVYFIFSITIYPLYVLFYFTHTPTPTFIPLLSISLSSLFFSLFLNCKQYWSEVSILLHASIWTWAGLYINWVLAQEIEYTLCFSAVKGFNVKISCW